MSVETPRSPTPAIASNSDASDLPLVLLLHPLFPAFDAALSPYFHFLKPFDSPLPVGQFLAAYAGSVRALLCPIANEVSAGTIALLPSLELVVACGVGVNHIDVAECRRRGISITNAGDVFADDSADYAVGLLIDVLYWVSAGDRFVRSGQWTEGDSFPLGSKLGGKRIGIVGLGNIGSRVAKRLEAFGCSIFYNSRTSKPHVTYKYFSNVTDLAAESDVLVLCCALTDETHHIINKDVMSALGKEGIIINVGRGPLIDEKEMVRCLMKGEIGGAGLDVFENEPEVPEELFTMDNVVLSHHRAVFTPESLSGLIQSMKGNLEAFFSAFARDCRRLKKSWYYFTLTYTCSSTASEGRDTSG